MEVGQVCNDPEQVNPSQDPGLDPAGNAARNRFEGAVRFKVKYYILFTGGK